jgi:hypothetical protein
MQRTPQNRRRKLIKFNFIHHHHHHATTRTRRSLAVTSHGTGCPAAGSVSICPQRPSWLGSLLNLSGSSTCLCAPLQATATGLRSSTWCRFCQKGILASTIGHPPPWELSAAWCCSGNFAWQQQLI